MNVRRLIVAIALGAAPLALPTLAQGPVGAARQDGWANFAAIFRLRDELAARPAEARLDAHHPETWAYLRVPVMLPAPYRTRAFTAESFVLLDIDARGHAAGCRPLRGGPHPRLDAFACTVLMEPGLFEVSLVPTERSLAGQWVMGLRWESLTAAAHRAREANTDRPLFNPGPPPQPKNERR